MRSKTIDCPYFSIDLRRNGKYVTLQTLPNLGNLSFFKYYDSFTCYQEIRMYLSNVLTKLDESPITTGSDEILAKQKGFDDMSFRTLAPGRKKLNRKINKSKKRNNV